MTSEDFTPAAKPTSNAWMITFADLTALLLTFFVLLFSMSSIEIAEWEEIVASLSERLGLNIESTDDDQTAPLAIKETFVPKAVDLDYFQTVLESKFAGHPILVRAELKRLPDRMVISVPSDVLFKPSSADLTETAFEAIGILGDAMLVVGNRIDVAGHTDPRPINTPAYPSNWELSLARAVTVASGLRHAGYSPDVAAIGYGDSRFEDLPTELSDEDRLNMARRVDIIIREGSGGAYAP